MPCSPDRFPVHSCDVLAAAGRRIGLFGGTFDPPHVGHLVTALDVRYSLGLDVVVLMVAHRPWQKEGGRRISPSADRLEMVRAAVDELDGLEAGTLEIERGGASYTADTLAELGRLNPGGELFTIVGDDAAAGLASWERWEEVVASSRMVVVDRPGNTVELPPIADWERVEVPRLEVSSTELRARVADGRPLRYLVPDAVLALIESRGFYRDPNDR